MLPDQSWKMYVLAVNVDLKGIFVMILRHLLQNLWISLKYLVYKIKKYADCLS